MIENFNLNDNNMKHYKLFNHKDVRKFFDILERLGRGTEKRYKGFDKLNPDYSPCEKEVFVKRTISKWFKGKHLIYFSKEKYGEYIKQYLYITKVSYYLGWGEEIEVGVLDYSRPYDIFNSKKVGFNTLIGTEGIWCEDENSQEDHYTLMNLTILNLPKKEFVFKAYDWNKYPKRKKRGQTEEDIKQLMTVPYVVVAQTEGEARDKLKDYAVENDIHVTGELMEVRDVL